jgi:hypothetical protein
VRLFEAFEDGARGLMKSVRADATPDVAVVQAIRSVEKIIGASALVKMRDVVSAAVRHVARFVRDPLVLNGLMTYAGIMCPEPSRVALMRLFAESDVLSVELREWAREWACIDVQCRVLHKDPFEELFAGRTKFKDHLRDPLELPLELLIRAASDFFETVDREIFEISSAAMQDRLFNFFLAQRFYFFHEDYGTILCRLVEQQLRRRPVSDVASRLSASRCMTNAPELRAEDVLREILRRVYSNVSQAQRNEAVHAVLAVKRSDGRYRANSGVFLSAIFLMRQLFKFGASPLVRDASGVLLIANVRCSRLRSLVNGQFVVERLDLDAPGRRGKLVRLIEKFTPVKWTVGSHHLFPDDFRERVRVLLLCNQRLRGTGAAHLSMDPLELVIQWLAVGEVLGEDAIENEMAKLEVEEEEEDDSDNDDDDDDDN